MHSAAVRSVAALAASLGWGTAVHATDVAVCTDAGRFVIELADAQAPKHVANFLQYVDTGYYTGTVLHRVVPGFVVQGGGVDRQLRPRATLPPVENESRNTLSNVRGSVAAARTADPDSATSQFYVNLAANRALDAGAEPGYTVFGRVREGLAVLDRIGELPTGAAGPFASEVPTPLIAIRSIVRFDGAALAEIPEENRATVLKERALAAEEHAEALEWIEHHRAVCAEPDPELMLREASAAAALERTLRARYVLEEYFQLFAEESEPTYAQALELYRQLTPDGGAAADAGGFAETCDKPQAPVVPDGGTATLDEMVSAQDAVRGFVAGSERYLECLANFIDDDDQTAAFRNAAISEHNQAVAAMEALAQDFNSQVREFKARE